MTFENIIKKGLELGLTEVELFARTSNTSTISFFDNKVETFNVKNISGLSIRGLYNGKMGYVYTESLEDEDIIELLNKLVENAKNLSTPAPEFIYDGQGEYVKVEPTTADYDKYSINDKISILRRLEAAAFKVDPRIVKVEGHYSENLIKTQIINSKGMNLTRENKYFYVYESVVGAENDQTSSGFGIDINTSINALEEARIVKDATNNALNALGADFVASGSYPVILSREVASDIFSAFASIFSGEMALKKMSILTDKINTKIFGENITICDDPFFKKAIVKISFDDEGVPCYTKDVVKDGVFKGFLHSQKTAKFYGAKPTGNGFKASVQSSVDVSPTNLYLKEGTLTKDEIIATTEKGIYITDVQGLHAGLNNISGDFNLQSSGFLIENGKLGKPITLFVVSGNFFEMMNNVELIGNDIQERCEGVVSPTLKIKSLSISGK